MSLLLYYSPGACSFAAHWALVEAGAEFELVRVALGEGEQNASAFRSINPHGKVPVLRTDRETITELPAILTYIALQYPDAALLPSEDPVAIAKILELMAWLSSTAHVAIAQIFRSERFADDETTKAVLKVSGRSRVLKVYDEIETLAQKADPWLMGRDFGVVDPYAFVFYNWGTRLSLDMNAYPAWDAHARRLLSRPRAERVFAAEGWMPKIQIEKK